MSIRIRSPLQGRVELFSQACECLSVAVDDEKVSGAALWSHGGSKQ